MRNVKDTDRLLSRLQGCSSASRTWHWLTLCISIRCLSSNCCSQQLSQMPHRLKSLNSARSIWTKSSCLVSIVTSAEVFLKKIKWSSLSCCPSNWRNWRKRLTTKSSGSCSLVASVLVRSTHRSQFPGWTIKAGVNYAVPATCLTLKALWNISKITSANTRRWLFRWHLKNGNSQKKQKRFWMICANLSFWERLGLTNSYPRSVCSWSTILARSSFRLLHLTLPTFSKIHRI